MRSFFRTLCLFLFGLYGLYANAAYKGCPDFTNLNATYVDAYASGYGNVVVNGRHTVIDYQGLDQRTGSKLNLIPDGCDKVVRLGDNNVGAQSESISYLIQPTAEECMMKLRYAVVFENPSHRLEDQPYFSVSVTDKDGNVLPNTIAYYVYAKSGLQGFQEYVNGDCRVMWRDWTDVILDLSSYVGKEIRISFETRDCLLGAHYSYAYFNGAPLTEFADLDCSGENITVTMADGFQSYSWSDGSTSKTYKGSIDQPVWCDVTSCFGDVQRIYVFKKDNKETTPDVVNGTVCECDDYYWNGIKIDTHFQGTHRITGVEVDRETCTSKNKILNLTATPIYYYFNDTICEGDSYHKSGFDVENPPLGIYRDTVEVASDNKCRRFNVLSLKVASTSISAFINGDATPCANSYRTYKIYGDCKFEWTLPSNALLDRGKNLTSDSVVVQFVTGSHAVLSVNCYNGCVSNTVTKSIDPVMTTKAFYTDTVCQGSDYNKGVWKLGVQNKLGYSTHVHQLGDSCNSVEVLVLHVVESVPVEINGDSVICAGQTVNLSTSDYKPTLEDDVIAIGDVWCTDGSIMHLKDFLENDKEAKGIVFEAIPSQTEENAYDCLILDIHDEFDGNGVLYDQTTMNDNSNLLSEFKWIFPKWNILNEYLAKINGADLLSDMYWLRDTNTSTGSHTRFGYDEDSNYDYVTKTYLGGLTYESSTYKVKAKVRYFYELTLKKK